MNQNIKPIASIIFVFIFVAFVSFFIRKCGRGAILKQVEDIETLKQDNLSKEFQLKQWRTKDSINVSQIKTLSVDKDILASTNNDLMQKLKSVGIKLPQKNIKEIITAKTSSSATIETKVDTVYLPSENEYADTEKSKQDTAYSFNYAGKYISIQGAIKNSLAKISYIKNDSLTFVKHNKKSWFLGSNKTYLTAFSADENTVITELKNIDITPKKRRFNLSIGGGYMFDGKSFKPAFGVYAGFSIIKL